MALLTVAPKDIRENIARAKGYLRKDEVIKAMESMTSALRSCSQVQIARTARFELEVNFDDFFKELCNHPTMRTILDVEHTGKPKVISYKRDKEGVLAAVLEGLAKILQQAEEEKEKEAKASLNNRKDELVKTGLAYILSGDNAKGRAYLKRAASEFGNEPGVLMEIAKKFVEVNCRSEAADLFEQLIQQNPASSEGYINAIEMYEELREYEKAEIVYLKVFKQFGGSAKTFGRAAKMYLNWNKRAKAEEFATRSLQLDKTDENAIFVNSKINKKG